VSLRQRRSVRIQDYAVDCAKNAAAEVFRYARAMPPDKLEWSPEGGQNAMSMCREIAITPTWALYAFGEIETEWNDAALEAQKTLMESWKTVDDCEAQFNERFMAVEKLFRGFTYEDLAKTKWLPYEGGRDFTFLEMLDYPRWNATYHLGQIAYIQTLYGDKEMH